jgi:hypothetical protein
MDLYLRVHQLYNSAYPRHPVHPTAKLEGGVSSAAAAAAPTATATTTDAPNMQLLSMR